MSDPFGPEPSRRPALGTDPFAAGPTGTAVGDPFAPSAAPSAPPSLEPLARQAGLGDYLPGPLGWASRALASPLSQDIVDFLSRPNYAIAGAIQASPGGPLPMAGRVGRELLSGIGSIQGEKKGFGQVMEEAGVPSLGAVSNVLPMPERAAAIERAQGIKDYIALHPLSKLDPLTWLAPGAVYAYHRGGPLDVTGRGVLGGVLDVAADPLTYLGVPTSGVEVLTEQGVRTLSKAGTKALGKEAAELLPKDLAALGRMTLPELPPAGRTVAEATAGKVAESEAKAAVLAAQPTITRKVAALKAFNTAIEESVPLQEMLQERTNELLRAGFGKGEEITRQFTRDTLEQARSNVIAAANSGHPEFFSRAGLTWAGMQVPGTEKAATLLSSGAHRAMAGLEAAPVIGRSVEAAHNAVQDAVGNLFSRDYLIRKYPYWQAVRQADRDWRAGFQADFFREVEALPEARAMMTMKPETRDAAFVRMTQAAEKGTEASLRPDERAVVDLEKSINARLALHDAESGSEYIPRANYVAHFYENSPEEVAAIFDRAQMPAYWQGKKLTPTLGPHGEERVFDTLKEAEGYGRWRRMVNPQLPELKPLWNPFERIARRTAASANYIGDRNLFAVLEKQFDQPLERGLLDSFDLRPSPLGRKLTAQEAKTLAAVTEAVKEGGTKVSWVKSLPDEAQREFIRQRLARVKDQPELDNVARKYGDLLAKVPSDTMTAPRGPLGEYMTPLNIAGSQVYAPEAIAQDLQRKPFKLLQMPAIKKLLEGYDRFMLRYKTGLTVVYPSFSFRNKYNDVANEMLNAGLRAANPRTHAEAFAVMGGLPGEFVTRDGARYSYKELLDLARRTRAIVPNHEFFDVGRELKPEVATGPLRNVSANLRAFTGFWENEGRLHLFMDALDKGADPYAASDLVKRTFFDYQNLSEFEREFMRRLIPFYTWPRKNAELQLKMMARRPGFMAAEAKPFRGRPDENADLPSWQSNAFKIRLERDGRNLTVLSGIDMPLKNLDTFWGGRGVSTAMRLIGQMTPLVKVPVAIGTRREPFTGRELTAQEAPTIGRFLESSPSWLKRAVGWHKSLDAAGRPRYTVDGPSYYALTQSWALSRVLSTSDRQFRSIASSTEGARFMLDILTGTRLEEYDLDAQAQRRAKEREAYLRDVLKRGGVIREGTYTSAVPSAP